MDYGLWVMRFYIGQTYGNVINHVIIENWMMYYSAMYECKESKKFIQTKNEWMIEEWSSVLMSRFEIHDPTGMGFEA